MRFLEKHARTILGDSSSPLYRGIVPVNINQVAEWYFSHEPLGGADHFKCVVSPWPIVFFEYALPERWKMINPESGKAYDGASGHGLGDQFGMLIVQEKLPENYTGKDPVEGRTIADQLALNPGTKLGYRQQTFFFAGNSVARVVSCVVENYVSTTGQLMGGPVTNAHASLWRDGGIINEPAVHNVISVYGFPVYAALSLLQCDEAVVDALPLTDREASDHQRRRTTHLNYRSMGVQALKESVQGDLPRALALAGARWEAKNFQAVTPSAETLAILKELETHRFSLR